MKRTTALTSAVLTLATFAIAGCSGVGSTTYGDSQSKTDSSQAVASADSSHPAMSNAASGSSTQTAVRVEAPNKGDKSSMLASSGVGGELLREAMAYPTGDKKSSVLLIEKVAPSKSASASPTPTRSKSPTYRRSPRRRHRPRKADGEFPDQTSPARRRKIEGQNQWAIGEIAAKGSKTIEVSGTPDKPGRAYNSCIGVTYSPTSAPPPWSSTRRSLSRKSPRMPTSARPSTPSTR